MRAMIPALVALVAAACGDTPGPGIICRADHLSLHNSALVVAGRSASLAAWAWGPQGFGQPAFVRWTSSNPGVADVASGQLVTKSEGTTLLTATACQLEDTVSVQVMAAGYSVTLMPEGFLGGRLSDSGHVTGVGTSWQMQLWRDGSTTSLGDCFPIAVNRQGVVLCSGAGPVTWHEGVKAVRDTFSMQAVALNDSGQMLLRTSTPPYRAVRWSAPGQYVELDGGAGPMNNRGDVIGYRADALYPDVVFLSATQVGHTLSGFSHWRRALDLNDSGLVVGSALHSSECATVCQVAVGVQWASPTRPPAMFRGYAGRGPANPIAIEAIAVNNSGQIIGEGKEGWFVVMDGRIGLLDAMISDVQWEVRQAHDINDHGQILVTLRHRSSGDLRSAVLSPPTVD